MKVVILACDKYTWLVPVFMHFYEKYWPDNPYRTEIVTEKDHLDGNVFYAKDASWSNRLIGYLRRSMEDKFLLVMEEHFIEKTVNTDRVKIAESLCEGNVGCVRLNPPDRYFKCHAIESGISGFREYPLDKRYSMSMQTSIWQKWYLLDVLRADENIWQTEIDGSERLKKLKAKWRILWADTPIIDYTAGGLMKKGRPRGSVVKWMAEDFLSEGRKT